MERGATLSLGQRQLLSFIRALLYNPSILILDEATSSIDTESEQLIEKAIETLIQGRTSIVIAHRLSTIRKADQILVLKQGKIIEKGTHQSLMEQGGFYKALNEMQFDPKKSA
jgi:ATP-binding cassette subfamily B multidrug efflux pump